MNKIYPKEFIESLLDIRAEIEARAFDVLISEKVISLEENNKHFRAELKIFSLWLITLIFRQKQALDEFHKMFFKELEMESDNIEIESAFSLILENRYKVYNDAYRKMIENPDTVPLIGDTMREFIKNKNSNFSLTNSIPLGDVFENGIFNAIFRASFSGGVKAISDLKKQFGFKDENQF